MSLELDAAHDFAAAIHYALNDARLRSTVRRSTTTFLQHRALAQSDRPDWEQLRQRAHDLKAEVINNLDSYLTQFENSVHARGGIVHRAADDAQARSIILDIARERGIKKVIKSKSMVSEEIELNHALEAAGIHSIETDLGEYIIQLAGERPSHIVAPVMHKNREDIREVFARRLGYEGSSEPTAMTAFARRLLRQEFLTAGLGLTGANFAIAETGTIVLVENEGNIRMTTTLPPVHVALVGIEKLIPRFEDLATFLRLLPRSGSGQKNTVYVSMVTGASGLTSGENSREFHVVLLDNGRRRMHSDSVLREALACIRCGACLNVCPVYQRIGGHAYGSIYPGPIGSLVTPGLGGIERGGHLAFASSLCGACKDVCPVKINIPHLLLHVRAAVHNDIEVAVGTKRKAPAWATGTPSTGRPPHPWRTRLEAAGESLGIRIWARLMRSPRAYQRAANAARRFQHLFGLHHRIASLPLPPFSRWTANRDFPALGKQSFRDWWSARAAARPANPSSRGHASMAPACAHGTSVPPTSGDLYLQFRAEFERLSGKWFDANTKTQVEELTEFVTAGLPTAPTIAVSNPEQLQQLGITHTLERRGCELISDEAADYAARLTDAHAGITGVYAAVAETGTLVLAGKEKSRRPSLLPPVHIAVLRRDQILVGWEELIASLRADPLPSAITCITGPSRTADIELTLCKGVHGPGEVRVICIHS